MGVRPPYGLLHYADRTFPIDFTFEAEERLLDILAEMRRTERRGGLPDRSHTSAARCRACGFREICDRRLV
jgi:CRISPR-associated exonuclease Cas4